MEYIDQNMVAAVLGGFKKELIRFMEGNLSMSPSNDSDMQHAGSVAVCIYQWQRSTSCSQTTQREWWALWEMKHWLDSHLVGIFLYSYVKRTQNCRINARIGDCTKL